MAHRSRLTSVLVDVPKDGHETAVQFWAGALGTAPDRFEELPEYVGFGTPTPGIEFMVQSTGDVRPRVHFDFETDDVEAEVERLTQLGASEIGRYHTWVVMRDPVGTVFCVVRVQQKEMFEAHARSWD